MLGFTTMDRRPTPLLLLLSCLFFQISHAQDCACDHVITQPGIYRPASQGSGPFYLDALPGQTICIQAGAYSEMRFFDFQGSPSAPITVKNCGGQAVFSNSNTVGCFVFENCKYFHVTGTGDNPVQYGFQISGSGAGASGLVVNKLSSDFEIDHVYVAAAGFAGMMVKYDPNCDPASWRDNFTMYNISIHDNYVTNTGGEGIYVGNSFWNNGMGINCDGAPTIVYPHNIIGLSIYNNLIEYVHADGLQYACSPDAQVHHNVINYAGQSPFAAGQDSGIQCGGGAGGDCYNNIIRNPGGTGIIVLGHLGGNKFFNNLVINAGGYGIFANDANGTIPNSSFEILNNTIAGSSTDAIRLYNQDNTITVINNVLAAPGSGQFMTLGQGATATISNNASLSDYTSVAFEDLVDFRPTASSALVNAGADMGPYGVTTDLDDLPRPVNDSFDIGAYENQSVLPLELLDFKLLSATTTKRVLSWDTGPEYEVKGYEVQRSRNGVGFGKIGFVPSSNFTWPHKYAFVDQDKIKEPVYYRLKMIDFNGAFKFSPIIFTDIMPERLLEIFARHGQIFVRVNEPWGPVSIEILDAHGRFVAGFHHDFLESGTVPFDLQNCQPGIYFARIWSNNTMQIKKIRCD